MVVLVQTQKEGTDCGKSAFLQSRAQIHHPISGWGMGSLRDLPYHPKPFKTRGASSAPHRAIYVVCLQPPSKPFSQLPTVTDSCLQHTTVTRVKILPF